MKTSKPHKNILHTSILFSFDREDDLERHHSAHLEHQLNNIDKIRVAKPTNNKRMDTRPALQNLRLQTYARLRERRLRRELTRHQDCPPIDHYAQGKAFYTSLRLGSDTNLLIVGSVYPV